MKTIIPKKQLKGEFFMQEPKILKLTFLLRKGTKIAEFELVDYSIVRNVEIYNDFLASIIFSTKPITAHRLTEIFKFFTDSNFTLKEYLDFFQQNGFYTPAHPNLALRISEMQKERLI